MNYNISIIISKMQLTVTGSVQPSSAKHEMGSTAEHEHNNDHAV